MRVLIADDEILIVELLSLILSNYAVVSARNGKEAIEKYIEFKPDLVLMDIMMPLMNGIEATKEILQIDPHAKILAVTASAEVKTKEILDSGVSGILEKPFTPEQLLDTIESFRNKLKAPF